MKQRNTILLISLGLAAALLVLGLLAGFVPQSEGPELRRRASGMVARLRPEDMPIPIQAQGDGIRQWAVRGAVEPHSGQTSGGSPQTRQPVDASTSARPVSAADKMQGTSSASGSASGKATGQTLVRRIVSFGSGGVILDTGEPSLAFSGDAQGDFAPLLALDGVSSPLLVSNQPRDYGDALDAAGRPLRWVTPTAMMAGYSPRVVRRAAIEVLRHGTVFDNFVGDIDDNDMEKLQARARRYQNLVENFSRRYNLSTELVYAIIHSESDFSPTLVSNKSAMGLMQVVPDTANDEVHKYLYGRMGDVGFDDLRVPETNIRYGTTYLHILFTRYFSGVHNPLAREYCAIAAYNMGPNRFLRLYGKTMEEAVDNINSMTVDAFYRDLATRLPARETRFYVARVQRMKAQYASLR
ncbi:transglycosylase SLT domain-containing protein [Desulfovibrio desulfuricans]|nr:transglycosylase SLT domain-containing protein [Desulfovibrio desulfuricans]